ncbi:hypothetical protein R1flu_029010 [Riccia fluitans]|uniref:Uncharacterized protein n=1 Tax=Riccia fluitans TaxID=41844 RepID=A0ABD1XNE8_9MARC
MESGTYLVRKARGARNKVACKTSQMESGGERITKGIPIGPNSAKGSNPWSDVSTPEAEHLYFSQLPFQAIEEESVTEVQNPMHKLVNKLAAMHHQKCMAEFELVAAKAKIAMFDDLAA